jgi:hypothetical protein
MPTDVVVEVMEHLEWDRGASAVFRRICKGWRDAHDERVLRLILNGNSLPSRFLVRMKFPRLKEIGVRVKPAPNHFVLTFQADKWLGRLAGLTDLVTSLDLSSRCYGVTNEGLRILAGLNLESCDQAVSDGEFRALAGFTALTCLNLGGSDNVSDDGLRALAGLTTITCLNLSSCRRVTDDGLQALLASFTTLTSLNLRYCD